MITVARKIKVCSAQLKCCWNCWLKTKLMLTWLLSQLKPIIKEYKKCKAVQYTPWIGSTSNADLQTLSPLSTSLGKSKAFSKPFLNTILTKSKGLNSHYGHRIRHQLLQNSGMITENSVYANKHYMKMGFINWMKGLCPNVIRARICMTGEKLNWLLELITKSDK